MASDFVQMDLLAWGGVHPEQEECLHTPFDEFIENDRRTKICPDWQACMHQDICFTPENEQNGICFIDEPDKVPRSGPFSRCELKVLAEGFSLVRYTRDEKKIEVTKFIPEYGWDVLEPFPTFAAAERKLKELKEQGCIETGLDGKIIMSGWNQPGGLRKAGFEFYRVYGFHAYDTSHCIKVGSKNWSNLTKYKDRAELRAGWSKLMTEDPKALEG
jgi:hypothetical protein